MAIEWLGNEGATERVIELLRASGLPLEEKTSRTCLEFCQSNCNGSFYMFSQPVVYQSLSEDAPFRELDQCLRVNKSFKIGNQRFEALLEIPIECKHRDGVQIFAFRQKGIRWNLCCFPILSPLSGSSFLETISAIHPSVVEDYGVSTVSLVEFSDGRTPQRYYDEQLVYKATASLYDFVTLDAFRWSSSNAQETLQEMGLLDRFYEDQKTKPDQMLSLYPAKWVETLETGVAREFRRKSRIPLLDVIRLVFPVVCTDSPLVEVHCNKKGQITGFSEIPCIVTSVRLQQWPHRVWPQLLRKRPEAIVALTPIRHLSTVLSSALSWYDQCCNVLQNASEEELVAAPLQAAITYAVRSASIYQTLEPYRSDLDIHIQLPYG